MTNNHNQTEAFDHEPIRWLMPDGSCTQDRNYGENYGGMPLYTAPSAQAAPQQEAWHKRLVGMEVSMDVSTGEHDSLNRIYGRVIEVMTPEGGNGVYTLVAEEESRNFTDTAPVAQSVPVAAQPQEPPLTDDQIIEEASFHFNADQAGWSNVISFARSIAAQAAPAVPDTDRKDAERLDFMATHEAWIGWSRDGDHCRVFHRNEDGDAVPMLGWGARHWRNSAREAIDDAISAAKNPDERGSEG